MTGEMLRPLLVWARSVRVVITSKDPRAQGSFPLVMWTIAGVLMAGASAIGAAESTLGVGTALVVFVCGLAWAVASGVLLVFRVRSLQDDAAASSDLE